MEGKGCTLTVMVLAHHAGVDNQVFPSGRGGLSPGRADKYRPRSLSRFRQAAQALVQAVGRIVRGPEDWGLTYILDEQFGKLYGRCPQMFPGWFHEGLKAGGWGELGED